MSFVLFAVAWCSIVAAQESSGGVNSRGCEKDSRTKVKFILVFEHKNSLPPYSVAAYIFVKPKNYNREFMKTLVLSLNSKYCSENHVSVAIFDDKRKAKDTDIAAYSLGEIIEPSVRGFYWLDRKKGISGVKFSTERGKPVDEQMIELAVESL
jgi:hypothetical protein